MILDLHLHSELSDDSRAPVEAYLKLLQRKRAERPLDGIVLTEHRQFDPGRDYRALEDRYGFLVLTAAEVETDYGHVLVYGVNEDILARFDFRNVRLPAQELIGEVARLGGIALPCHPGRPTVGLCAHYETKPPLEGVVAVEAIIKLLQRKRAERPLDGIVLTEHRQFDPGRDYRALEDRYGFLVLTAAEVETDYGHVLVYGVNEDILARFDFRNVRLPAQELIGEVARLGGIALPCHPGRPTVGLCAHYETKPPLEGVVAVEAINGGSRKGEDERVEELIRRYGYKAYGGSDSHLVSFVGICATEFEAPIRTIDDLVRELKGGRYRPVDFRPRRAVAG
ncbi:MAG: hypothetical protein E6J57_08970 [Deltaproteobacteria bacterium]|nr:MAG: hypothetical protein E6J57_08970 [Deltaproteobacteria bacterium]